MHADPVEYKASTIMPLAPVSIPGYAATAIVTVFPSIVLHGRLCG
jgi:hypothetical protein